MDKISQEKRKYVEIGRAKSRCKRILFSSLDHLKKDSARKIDKMAVVLRTRKEELVGVL